MLAKTHLGSPVMLSYICFILVRKMVTIINDRAKETKVCHKMFAILPTCVKDYSPFTMYSSMYRGWGKCSGLPVLLERPRIYTAKIQ